MSCRSFVRNFGTHYMSESWMGATLITEARFDSHSFGTEEREQRSACVNSAYQKGISDQVKANKVDISVNAGQVGAGTSLGGWAVGSDESFSASLKKCSGFNGGRMSSGSDSMATTSVVSVGSLPSANTEEWAKSVGKNPSVVRFKLKPISDLFKSEWVNDIPLVSGMESGEKLRAATLRGHFDDVLDNYCRVMLGEDCDAVVEEDKGCGINGFCSPKQVCVNDKSVDEGYKCQDSESENDAVIFNFQKPRIF